MPSTQIKAGERKRILYRFGNSLQTDYAFSATPKDDSRPVSGTIEVKGSGWLSPKPATNQSLQSQNRVFKGAWDTFYSVYVTPDVDVEVTLTKGRSGSPMLIVWVAVGLIILATVATLIF